MEYLMLVLVIAALLYVLLVHDRDEGRRGHLTVDGTVMPNTTILRPQSWINRRVGLLNHGTIPHGFGLWLKNTRRVHTVGMMSAIDVVFIDSKNRVQQICAMVPPGTKRVGPCRRAKAALELPPGAASELLLVNGSTLGFVPVASGVAP